MRRVKIQLSSLKLPKLAQVVILQIGSCNPVLSISPKTRPKMSSSKPPWTKTFNAQQSWAFRKCSKPKYPQSPRHKPPLSSCQLTEQSVPWWEDAKPKCQARLTARHRRFAKRDQRLNQLCMAPLSNLVIRLLI